MDTEIKDEAAFKAAIDQLGDTQAEIKRLEKSAKMLKLGLETFAEKNKITRCCTDRFRLAMEKSEPALICKKGYEHDTVVKLLKKSETLRECLYTDFDANAIKQAVLGTPDGGEILADYGLMLTTTHRHVKVTER